MTYLRLKKKKDFSKILRSGKRAFSSTLTVSYLPSREVRMAVCVGKKYGKSVQRNRIKRQVRMMVDEIFDFHEDFDTVLIVRPKYDSENYLNNKKSLERLKKKVKMI